MNQLFNCLACKIALLEQEPLIAVSVMKNRSRSDTLLQSKYV